MEKVNDMITARNGKTPPPPGADIPQGPPGSRPPPRAVHAGRYGQQAGGTHPTGMHSCY